MLIALLARKMVIGRGWERSRADTVAGFLTNMTIEEGEKYDKYDDMEEREKTS